MEHKKNIEKIKTENNKNINSSRSKSPSRIIKPFQQNNVNQNLQQFSKNISTANDSRDISINNINRAPIKVTRQETQVANKKVKNVNFSKLSNKKTIKSAISNVCLGGEPNRVCREKILEIVEKCPCENFIILFKGNFGRFVSLILNQDLKAVYTFNPQTERTELLTCLQNSPIVLETKMVSNFYKYDNTQKDFRILQENKVLSLIVDAVTITTIK